MTAVGFEPTPLRNGALSHRLRPLGQTVLEGSKTCDLFRENRPTCLKENRATQDLPICSENYRTHSSVGQSIWPITIRSPVQAWMGPLPEWKIFFLVVNTACFPLIPDAGARKAIKSQSGYCVRVPETDVLCGSGTSDLKQS